MKKVPIILILSIFIISCTKEVHFISDKNYRMEVQKQFERRKVMAQNRERALFSIFDKKLTTEQCEALQFLYAYMPLSDLADYDGDFFLKQVNTALQARETFSWGKDIPEDIFRHFVLPYRVNNEDLDTARLVFFDELKNRIKDLSLYDAVLEVNHWSHEKVNYKGADIRTSAPLATMCTSWGRCGEESTFTVTALRAVGIPARQVYTPRWAHTDDNHAWVEVFVDGKWQYLGASEPEPALNIGWFDKPVKRAMMVHSNVFGTYNGTEEKLLETPLYTKINTLANYTKTKDLHVKVTDKKDKPIANATVTFGIYNYAEFYPMVTEKTDEKGIISINTGLGDLLISASKNNMYGYTKSVGTSTDTATIIIKHLEPNNYEENLDIFPPVELTVKDISNEKRIATNKRMIQEDSIRNKYTTTFMQPDEAEALAKKLNINIEKTKDIISKSYGNWKEISLYLQKNATDDRVFDLLYASSEKDIRDTPESIFTAHLKATQPNDGFPAEVYNEGILSPRIENELLSKWRSFFQKQIATDFANEIRSNPEKLVQWILENTEVKNEENYYHTPIRPQGSFELKITDTEGRKSLFVAMARSVGLPARINIITSQPQYYRQGEWKNVNFEQKAQQPTAILILKNSKKNKKTPEYYIHFTLQKFENGAFRTLDFENSNTFEKFPAKIVLETGYYCLMTGNRDNDGNVMVKRTFFELKDDQPHTAVIELRPLEVKKKVLGTVNPLENITDMQGKTFSLKELIGKKGMVIAIIDPNKEPSRHIMVDIPLLKAEFDEWGGNFLFAIPNDVLRTNFDKNTYKGLPKNTYFAVDDNRKLHRILLNATKNTESNFYPFVFFINTKGEVTFYSSGYRIGIGESLLKETR